MYFGKQKMLLHMMEAVYAEHGKTREQMASSTLLQCIINRNGTFINSTTSTFESGGVAIVNRTWVYDSFENCTPRDYLQQYQQHEALGESSNYLVIPNEILLRR